MASPPLKVKNKAAHQRSLSAVACHPLRLLTCALLMASYYTTHTNAHTLSPRTPRYPFNFKYMYMWIRKAIVLVLSASSPSSASEEATIKEMRGNAGFSAETCVPGKPEQQWMLSKGVAPGGSHVTNVQMFSNGNGGPGGCWEITGCSTAPGAAVGCGYVRSTVVHGLQPSNGLILEHGQRDNARNVRLHTPSCTALFFPHPLFFFFFLFLFFSFSFSFLFCLSRHVRCACGVRAVCVRCACGVRAAAAASVL